MNTTTQSKPRIRCRHYTPSYATNCTNLFLVRAVDDPSPLASHIVDWKYVAEAASKALDASMTRFHPRNIVQRAITLPCTGGEQ